MTEVVYKKTFFSPLTMFKPNFIEGDAFVYFLVLLINEQFKARLFQTTCTELTVCLNETCKNLN